MAAMMKESEMATAGAAIMEVEAVKIVAGVAKLASSKSRPAVAPL